MGRSPPGFWPLSSGDGKTYMSTEGSDAQVIELLKERLMTACGLLEETLMGEECYSLEIGRRGDCESEGIDPTNLCWVCFTRGFLNKVEKEWTGG